MEDVSIASIWKFMSENTLDIESGSVTADLTCGMCSKLMIDACKTVCGCHYCYKCISEYLADGDKYCPGMKEYCNEEKLKFVKNVWKHSILNKKVLAVKVRCPNQSCECYIMITLMDDHLRLCTKQQTECPFVQIGCDNEGASKDVIVTHLQNEIFTHSQLLIELIHNMKNEVDGLKLEISSLKEESKIKDKHIEEIKLHLNDQKNEMIGEMEKQKLELECLKEESHDRKVHMEDHVRELDRVKEDSKKKESAVTKLEEEFGKLRNVVEARMGEMTVQMKEQISEVERNSKKKESGVTKLEEEFGKLRNVVETKRGEMTVQMKEQKCEVERDSKKKESAIVALKEELGKLRNEVELRLTAMTKETKKREIQVEEQRLSIDDIKKNMREGMEKYDESIERRMHNLIKWNKLLTNTDVDFVWKVEEFTKKMTTLKGERFPSESFHSNNYKLCLRIYNGYGDSGDGIILSCVIMRGDYDDRAQWPLRLSVTVSIINQINMRTHTSQTVNSDTYKWPDKSIFDRPKADMHVRGICNPYSSFIEYSSIKDDKSVVVNDSIIVTCGLGERQ